MTDQEETRRRGKPEPQLREIIVKFQEGGSLGEREGRLQADHLNLERFHRAVGAIKEARVRKSFKVEDERLEEIKSRVRRNLDRPAPSLDLFVRIQVPDEADVESLLRELNADPEIEYASLAGIPGPPPVTPDYTGQQDYQDPAPDGIDAAYAWFFPGGEGNGVQICDCEYGFDSAHEDLPPVTVVSNQDGDLTQWENHGTAVLGELGAVADAKGITGIAPVSALLFASESGGHRLDCINDAILSLNAGDILVLEMQTGPGAYKPAEYDPDVHAAVVAAVGLGIVVIAAAGNGGVNLTTTTNANGDFIWNPASPDYDDSGAIIVGAGGSTSNANPHSKLDFSNYGVRVDCQGWGQDVVSTGYGDLYNGGANAEYTDTFGGTSSATPIVAGLAACLQGAAIQALAGPLTPATVRALLSDPTNGTPQANSPSYPAATYPIGPLPDLRQVLREAGIYPDVYMRDNVADTGVEPYMGGVLCWSPDIIARKNIVADPATDFGPATWGDPNLGEKVEFGQENYIYVRMHNRGNAPDDVTVSVYWTPASGFLLPPTWNLLGTLNVNNMMPGEYRVDGPVTWPSAQVPTVGHYCLIAVVNSTRDPLAVPGVFSSVGDYLDFVRNHNNICYRNIDVEDAVPGAPVPPYKFLLRGLPEKAARFRLEVRYRLPEGARVEVEVKKPIRRFERIEVIKGKKGEIRRLAPETVFKIEAGRPLIIEGIHLKQGAEVPAEIRVDIPKEAQLGEYLIYADQYLGDAHLGRVNYMLRVIQPEKGKRG